MEEKKILFENFINKYENNKDFKKEIDDYFLTNLEKNMEYYLKNQNEYKKILLCINQIFVLNVIFEKYILKNNNDIVKTLEYNIKHNNNYSDKESQNYVNGIIERFRPVAFKYLEITADKDIQEHRTLMNDYNSGNNVMNQNDIKPDLLKYIYYEIMLKHFFDVLDFNYNARKIGMPGQCMLLHENHIKEINDNIDLLFVPNYETKINTDKFGIMFIIFFILYCFGRTEINDLVQKQKEKDKKLSRFYLFILIVSVIGIIRQLIIAYRKRNKNKKK